MIEATKIMNPYPGLRSFEFDEHYLFFGREGLSEELLKRLQKNRFLAVVGTSGSGKSSLVKAGLLPLLHGGFMAGAGSHWRIALFRPGDQPIHNLAVALNSPDACEIRSHSGNGEKPGAPSRGGASLRKSEIKVAVVETMLRRSAVGLTDCIKRKRKDEFENYLLVVDQFEELFRFKERARRPGSEDEASAFVKLLLAAVAQTDVPIYVIITMRSDFLGDCAQFRDLPEAINKGQYLIPRLSRDQQRKAITAPASVYSASMSPRLIHRLLNDVGDDPDQLPILQHALMRTWECWSHRTRQIDVQHYEKIGGMKEALSKHADEAFAKLADEKSRTIAMKLFKALTESQENRVIRRPAKVSEICEITGADQEEVTSVINNFRGEHTSFLMPPMPVELTAETLIDISHESLIRNWDKLREWAEGEAASAQAYRRLVEAAVAEQKEKGNLLRDLDLSSALKWKDDNDPTPAWAKRYSPQFELAMGFLARSEKSFADEQEKERVEAQEKTDRERDLLLSRQEKAEADRLRAEAEKRTAQEAQLRAEAEQQRIESEKQREYEARLRAEAEQQRAKEQENTALERARAAVEKAEEQERIAKLERQYALEQAGMVRKLRWTVFALVVVCLFAAAAAFYAFNQRGIAVASAQAAGHQQAIAEEQRRLAQDKTREVEVQRQAAQESADSERKAKEDANKNYVRAQQAEQEALENAKLAASQAQRAREQEETANSLKRLAEVKAMELENQNNHLQRLYDALKASNQREAQQTFDLGRQELLSGSPLRALVYFNETNQDTQKQSNPALRYLLAQTTRSVDAQLSTLMTTPVEKAKRVTFATFSPNDKFVVTTSEDETAALWDPASGTIKARLIGHTGRVNSAAVSPDNSLVATVSSDRLVKLWSADGKLIRTLEGHSKSINSVVFASTGDRLLTASNDGKAIVWDINKPDPVHILEHDDNKDGSDSAVRYATFNPQGTLIITTGDDSVAKIWDATGHEKISFREHHKNSVVYAAFDPKFPRVATASANGSGMIWDLNTARPLAPLNGHTDELTFIAYGRDRIVTTGKDETARLWDADTGRLVATLKGHSADVVNAHFSYAGQPESSPDGRIVTASRDGTAKIWEVPSGKLLMTLEGHTDGLWSARFSSDGKRVVTASSDKSAKLWNVEKTTRLGQLLAVNALSFSPQPQIVRSDLLGNPIVLRFETGSVTNYMRNATGAGFDTAGPKLTIPSVISFASFDTAGERLASIRRPIVPLLRDPNHAIEVRSRKGPPVYLKSNAEAKTAIFNHDGTLVVTAHTDNSARIWNSNTGQLVKTLKGHAASVNFAAFNSTGNRVITASNDQTVNIYDLSSVNAEIGPILTLRGHRSGVYAATFSSDGNLIVTAGRDRTAKVWDATNAKLLRTLTGHQGRVYFAAFNPSNHLIVTASADGTAKVWDPETGGLLATFEGHTTEVRNVIFNRDGTQVVTVSAEGMALVWDMTLEKRSAADINNLLANVPYQYQDGQVVSK